MRNVACLPESDRRKLFRNTADKMGLNNRASHSRYFSDELDAQIFL